MIYTFAIHGFSVVLITVEADILRGLPYFGIVGLADASIKEARERVRSAILASKLPFPRVRKIINLSPAALPKHGSTFDVPIAIALLCASGYITVTPSLKKVLQKTAYIGELGLDGSIRVSKSIFPLLHSAKEHHMEHFVIPEANLHEAQGMTNSAIHPVNSLNMLVESLKKGFLPPQYKQQKKEKPKESQKESLWQEIHGHYLTKRMLIIAAAGHHNTILRGSPGVGKTILAQAIQEILPPLTTDEQNAFLYRKSLSGILQESDFANTTPPMEYVDVTTKLSALTGSKPSSFPGIFAGVHNGILFLDEIGLYNKELLTNLRHFLEYKKTKHLHTDCMVVGALNQCQCALNEEKCLCTTGQKQAYYRKIGTPFFDRFDLFGDVQRVAHHTTLQDESPAVIHDIQKTIIKSRLYTKNRGQKVKNGNLSLGDIKKYCALKKEDKEWLIKAAEQLYLSTRALHKVIKVSRTIADLEEKNDIERHHIAEALQYRIKIP